MTKEQFINLIRKPSTINLNLIGDLEDIAVRFPFFQNAHLLLAKQYHGHENIKYEGYLRKASAYAPNREKLYSLIKEYPLEVIHIGENENTTEAIQTTENEILKSEKYPTDDDIKSIPGELETTEEVSKDYSAEVKKSEQTPTTPLENNNPLSIIEKRLEEISNEDKPVADDEKKEVPVEAQSALNNETLNVESEIEDVPISDVELSGNEHEQHSKATNQSELEDELNLVKEIDSDLKNDNSTSTETPYVKSDNDEANEEKKREKHTFNEWLKLKNVSSLPSETGQEYLLNDDNIVSIKKEQIPDADNNLIEEFIKKEPRIGPARSEFYSPGNMARKSAQENSNLVSETLAKIYAQQGNLSKAIDAYKKLLLKKPEKSGYFAALIKDLEEKEQKEE